jgi:hypothetical protein
MSSTAGYSADSNDVSPGAVEFPLLAAIAREQLLETQQAEKRLSV